MLFLTPERLDYGLKTSICSLPLSLADGSQAEVADVDFTVLDSNGLCSITTVDLFVMKSQFPCILGLPWIQSARPEIDWTSRRITFPIGAVPAVSQRPLSAARIFTKLDLHGAYNLVLMNIKLPLQGRSVRTSYSG
jgi:hypothetical protein